MTHGKSDIEKGINMFNQQRLEEYIRQHLDWYHFYGLWV
jgi:hypothetical protein